MRAARDVQFVYLDLLDDTLIKAVDNTAIVAPANVAINFAATDEFGAHGEEVLRRDVDPVRPQALRALLGDAERLTIRPRNRAREVNEDRRNAIDHSIVEKPAGEDTEI